MKDNVTRKNVKSQFKLDYMRFDWFAISFAFRVALKVVCNIALNAEIFLDIRVHFFMDAFSLF